MTEVFEKNLETLPNEIFENLKFDIVTRKKCLSPLIVAKIDNKYYLIDGHHRLKICTTNKIDFQAVVVEFSTELEAKLYAKINQRNRRNEKLATLSACYKTLEDRKELEELGVKRMSEGGKNKKTLNTLYKLSDKHDTTEILAKSVGIGRTTLSQFFYCIDYGTDIEKKSLEDKKSGFSIGLLFDSLKNKEEEITKNGNDEEKESIKDKKNNNIKISDIHNKYLERKTLESASNETINISSDTIPDSEHNTKEQNTSKTSTDTVLNSSSHKSLDDTKLVENQTSQGKNTIVDTISDLDKESVSKPTALVQEPILFKTLKQDLMSIANDIVVQDSLVGIESTILKLSGLVKTYKNNIKEEVISKLSKAMG